MKARITILTIGVDDLERSLAFYAKGLGSKKEAPAVMERIARDGKPKRTPTRR
jgi:catechol 2,3-dioxygenase-like lactoylglutathione lyase family enzyme